MRKWSRKWKGGLAWAGILICRTIDWSGCFFDGTKARISCAKSYIVSIGLNYLHPNVKPSYGIIYILQKTTTMRITIEMILMDIFRKKCFEKTFVAH